MRERTLARYFFHLRDCNGQVLDPEGVELPVSGSVQSQALVAARDALSQKAKKDLGDPDARIDVEDEHGAVIYRLRLRDAFRVE